MESKEEIWKYLELSRDLPAMEEIILAKHDTREFVIEGLSCRGNEVVRAVFFAPAVITYRRMKVHDTYNFPPGEQDDAGFLSVSDNSAFLNWYRSVRLFDTEKDKSAGVVRSYKISTDSDVIEVISYAPPKIYYSPDLVIEDPHSTSKCII